MMNKHETQRHYLKKQTEAKEQIKQHLEDLKNSSLNVTQFLNTARKLRNEQHTLKLCKEILK